MQQSDVPDRNRVVIQQLLFGYDRGHSLLAASSSAAKALAPSILPSTDWDPRTTNRTRSYLTGLPLPEGKTYAVMRTWKAPEMPRPGCVWTHALLISAPDLARIRDLSALERFFTRPEEVGKYGKYLDVIEVDSAEAAGEAIIPDDNVVTYLVRLTYGQVEKVPPDNLHALERGLMAIWSQQWPGLRRKFSFRSAMLSRSKSLATSNFDVELSNETAPTDAASGQWEAPIFDLVSNDILEASTSPLRRFLWRYGADTGNHRQDLVRLTRIYRDLVLVPFADDGLSSIITLIAKWYPRPRDAHLLKADICDSGTAKFSLIPELDTLSVFKTLFVTQAHLAFPPLEAVDRPTIKAWLDKKSGDLIELLSACVDSECDFAEVLFAEVSTAGCLDFMWELYARSEEAFLRVSGHSLNHLIDPRIDQIEDEKLLMLLAGPKIKPEQFSELVPFLLSRRNADLISMVAGKAEEAVTKSVVEAMARGDDLSLDSGWVKWVKEHPSSIIDFATSGAELRSQLLICRYMLNADAEAVEPAVWSTLLRDIPNDLSGSVGLEFRVFLLIQALRSPASESVVLFADALDPVYTALEKRELPSRAEMWLTEYLPSIGWMANWDKCKRLKIAVAATCRYLGVSKKSMLALTANRYLREDLRELWKR